MLLTHQSQICNNSKWYPSPNCFIWVIPIVGSVNNLCEECHEVINYSNKPRYLVLSNKFGGKSRSSTVGFFSNDLRFQDYTNKYMGDYHISEGVSVVLVDP